MRLVLLWLNLVLATVLASIYYQPALFLPERESQFVVIAAARTGSEPYEDARNAARDFERDWGVRTTVLDGGAAPETLARALKNAMDLDPEGISLPGHTDAALLMPLITESRRRGIFIAFHDTSMPAAEALFHADGAGFAGSHSALNGELAALMTLRRHAADAGVHALVAGTEPSPAPGSRTQGCMKGIEMFGGTAEYLQVTPVSDGAFATAADPAVMERIARAPKPAFVFWDAGPVTPLTAALAEYLTQPGDISAVIFEPDEAVPFVHLPYIKQRFGTDRKIAAYMSLVQLFLSSRYEVPGMQVPLCASY